MTKISYINCWDNLDILMNGVNEFIENKEILNIQIIRENITIMGNPKINWIAVITIKE